MSGRPHGERGTRPSAFGSVERDPARGSPSGRNTERILRTLALASILATACKAGTARPYFPPVTGAPTAEIELKVLDATEALADVLKGDSLPVEKVVARDGFVETAWFKTETKQPTHARRLGPDVVQVRAWVDPSRPGYSRIVIETVYRPLADPSLSGRDLERQVPLDHPIGKRMGEIITQLAKLYSTQPDST